VPSEGFGPKIVHEVGETLHKLKVQGFSILVVGQNTTLVLRVVVVDDDDVILNTTRIVYDGRSKTRERDPSCSMPISAFIVFSIETTTMPMIELDGRQVEYAQTGAGADLLLLHSLLTELSVFEQVLPALAASHRVTSINLPGFGASGPAEFATVADYADHVARAMDALKLPATTDVFGNGFGAFVALELAIRHVARFGRLLVADTVAAFPEPARLPCRGMAEKVRANGMQAVLDTAIGRMFPAEFQAAHPEVIARRRSSAASARQARAKHSAFAGASIDLRRAMTSGCAA